MAKLRVWSNNYLTGNTKLCTYAACLFSILLYGSKTWTMYASEEKRCNSFYLPCLRYILHISWQGRMTNSGVFKHTGIPSWFDILSQRHLRWLGHVCWVVLITSLRTWCMVNEWEHLLIWVATPMIQNLCKWDMQLADISINTWESMVDDWEVWRAMVINGVENIEKTRNNLLTTKGPRRKVMTASTRDHLPSPTVTVQEIVSLGWDLSATLGNVPRTELYTYYTIVSLDGRMPTDKHTQKAICDD